MEQVDQDPVQVIAISVDGKKGNFSLIATVNGIGLWSWEQSRMVGKLNWN